MISLHDAFPRLLCTEDDATTLALAQQVLSEEREKIDLSSMELPLFPPLPSLLYCYAPTALLQWDWLRRCSHAGSTSPKKSSTLFGMYLDAAGIAHPTQSLATHYRALLTQAGVFIPSLSSCNWELPTGALLGPCLTLSLGRFPESRWDTILGYTLAHCKEGIDWVSLLEKHLKRENVSTYYCERQYILCERYLPILEKLKTDDKNHNIGQQLYLSSLRALNNALLLTVKETSAIEQQIDALLKKKLPYALGHHKRVILQDRCLDEWLQKGDWLALRDALLVSGMSQSFIRALQFGQPMFGVFSGKEQECLSLWLSENVF